MSPRQTRAIRNEALFREVNHNIAELERRFHGTESFQVLPLVCECAITGCSTPIEVDPKTFDRVRKHPLQFFVAPGHEQRATESIIERRPGYFIVEKHVT